MARGARKKINRNTKGRVIIREPVSMEHGAWRPDFRSLIQLNRFARNGLRSIDSGGTGAEDRRGWEGCGCGEEGKAYHTVSTVFYLEKEYRAAGPRLTASGSARVESGRVSSLYSIPFFLAYFASVREQSPKM